MTRKEFKDLFETNFAPLRNYLFYRCGNTEVATDIAQEAFLKIWEKGDSIQPEIVKGLLYKIAGNLFVSHYRKEKRSFEFFENYIFDTKTQSPEDEMTFNQLKESYQKTLDRMREKQRTVFLMSRVENLKYAEIAETLGISQKAVEKRMNAALEHLRKLLKRL